MLIARVIPCLLLDNNSLVKTTNFKNSSYIGDPVNTARIFNELEVDELSLLDITATNNNKSPNFDLISQLANECFMPLAYGGGINKFEDAKKIFKIGIEKIIINTAAFENPDLITQLAEYFGNQAVIISIDIRKNIFGKYHVYSHSGNKNQKIDPILWAQKVEELGAGEILLTSINQEGTWKGFDLDITKKISNSVSIPVIAHGGASSILDIEKAIKYGDASAACLGSMVVYQNKGMGVLINFPDRKQLINALNK